MVISEIFNFESTGFNSTQKVNIYTRHSKKCTHFDNIEIQKYDFKLELEANNTYNH